MGIKKDGLTAWLKCKRRGGRVKERERGRKGRDGKEGEERNGRKRKEVGKSG